MNLTKENFTEQWPLMRESINDAKFLERGDFVFENLDLYGMDEIIDKGIDKFFSEHVPNFENQSEPIPTPKPKKKSKAKNDWVISNEQCAKMIAKKPKETRMDISYLWEKKTEDNIPDEDEPTPKPKKPTKPKAPKEPKPKAPKVPKEPKAPKDPKAPKPPKYDSLVNRPCLQVRLAARLVKLQGQMFNAENKDKAVKILNALQKAILNHEIRKEGYGQLSAYANEMRLMQKVLVNMANSPCDASREISIEEIDKLRRVARAEGSSKSAECMRKFQRLSTLPNPTQKQAKELQDNVDKVIGNNEAGDYEYVLREMQEALIAFTSGKSDHIDAREQTLDGIRQCTQKKN